MTAIYKADPTVPIPAHIPPDLIRHWAFATAPGVEEDPYAANKVLLEGPDIFYSPLMRSPTDNGSWVITRARLIREALTSPTIFLNKNTSGLTSLTGDSWDLVPLEKDPPEHLKYRILLNPLFSPKRMTAMEDEIRRLAIELIDEVRASGRCEFNSAFSRPFPSSIFLDLLGLPLDMTDQFVEWETMLLQGETFEIRAIGAKAARDYLIVAINDRRENPRDDFISHIIKQQVDGKPITEDDILGICFLMFVGGLDTVTSTLGFMFKRLAEDQATQQRLREEPDLIPGAVEELLRAYAVVNSPKHLSQDIEFHGVQMKKGERVVLAMSIAGRDDEEFDNPDEIDLAREHVRHLSFATGPHNCIGQHLARREIRIAIEEWLARVPPFSIDPQDRAVTHGVVVFGVSHLPLVWEA